MSVNTVRTSVEVEPSGNAYTGTFTLDMRNASGGEMAPMARGTLRGTRIVAEPAGTPTP